ncbi:MAG: methionine--tRNA ligase [Bacteroidota bacterium]
MCGSVVRYGLICVLFSKKEMSNSKHKRIMVTAALPYANGPVHLGHLAGAYLPADLYCRYERMKGSDLVFVCGSDEMGVAIMIRARQQGISPQDIVDKYHPMIKDAFEKFGMSFDIYTRTTTDIHRETSQAFFNKLAASNSFKLKTEEQLFDPEVGIFLADRFVKGTCPNCGNEDAYGDQCERCGTALSPRELVNPKSTLSEATPELRQTTHWYLPLGDFQPALEDWINTHPEWKPNVLGQVKSWFNDGLKDRAITRDVPWGVPVPDEAAALAGTDAAGKVIYVWFDAPIGYISATREWAAAQGDPEKWKPYWQDQETKLLHFIGKDNIVFHCLMFPAMLQQHGDYVLPENVPANEFLNIEGKKLSTSRGWAVWLHEFLEDFDPDLLRYALATMLPESKDADFSWKDFQARVNSELADVLGNFVNRTLTFANRYFDGVVPPLENPSALDHEVLTSLAGFPEKIGASYDAYRNREAVFETMSLARMGNKYFNDTEPWHTRKNDMQKCGNTIHVSLQICASLAILLEPVLPHTAQRLRDMLQLTGVRSSLPENPGAGTLGWHDAGQPLLEAGHGLNEAEILFTKIDDAVIEEQIGKLNAVADDAAPAGPAFEPIKDEIVYDDFAKLDLRMGTIEVAEKVPKADKLLRLEINLGFEERQILSGVAEQMDPEDLVGKRVVVVANLKPRKLRGFESQGMVLMAENRDGVLSLIDSAGEDGAPVL